MSADDSHDQARLGEAMTFLEGMTEAVVESSRVRPGQSVAGSMPNTTGDTLIRPGGRDSYPAFWIRDFAMSLASERITPDELAHAIRLVARLQAPRDWQTPSGSLVPQGAIADHITFDGKPIYFPGTYTFEEQGQPWGYYPSFDDHYYFVEMVWRLAISGGRPDCLDEVINGIRLLDRLTLAFSMPPAEERSGLVWCDEARRGVSFGFTDSIVQTGCLLFASLLRRQAALQMADLYDLSGEPERAEGVRLLAAIIAEHVPVVFRHDSGLLRASTGRSAQPDVWGSAFAIFSGALQGPESRAVGAALGRDLVNGAIAWQGGIRHVPTYGDFSEDRAWEKPLMPGSKNRYQNGAYWNTPIGWVCHAIAPVDLPAARQLALDYVDELSAGDYRRGEACGAPYECVHPDGNYRQNPVYMTSVTCPLAAFRRLGWAPCGPGSDPLPRRERGS